MQQQSAVSLPPRGYPSADAFSHPPQQQQHNFLPSAPYPAAGLPPPPSNPARGPMSLQPQRTSPPPANNAMFRQPPPPPPAFNQQLQPPQQMMHQQHQQQQHQQQQQMPHSPQQMMQPPPQHMQQHPPEHSQSSSYPTHFGGAPQYHQHPPPAAAAAAAAAAPARQDEHTSSGPPSHSAAFAGGTNSSEALFDGNNAQPSGYLVPVQHNGPVYCSELDSYGGLLATAGADGIIKIFDLASGRVEADLTGHNGPIWSVSWGHPRFGKILASGGQDGRVIVWHAVAQQQQQWQPLYVDSSHLASVNRVAFHPEIHLRIASVSNDGSLGVISYDEQTGQWSRESVHAHNHGALCVAWLQLPGSHWVLVTGGCDETVRVWSEAGGSWTGHIIGRCNSWVRDVACKRGGIAGASADGMVRVWDANDDEWNERQTLQLREPWGVRWSQTGMVLAVAETDCLHEFIEGRDGTLKSR